MRFPIGSAWLGEEEPTYFIADIAANHDGDLDRARDLMTLAKQAGADCAKFQHFRAPHIVSDYGFRNLGSQLDHQAGWRKSVFEVYQDASLPWEWTEHLATHAQDIGIEFMSAPYDLAAVDHIDPYVNAYKVGSGDINWIEELEHIAAKNKPVIIATGASTIDDVDRAVAVVRIAEIPFSIMQCNTNYTGSIDNLGFVNLRVLPEYSRRYPDAVLGLSDHTPGHATVLGAVALGARVVEKHFTDDTSREGPDHGFSMDPNTWRAMVDAARELESSLGDGVKKVEGNEGNTVVLQRRCVRASRDIPAGTTLQRSDLDVLRPAPREAVPAHDVGDVVGRVLTVDVVTGQEIGWNDLSGV